MIGPSVGHRKKRTKEMKSKLTREERNWVLYDIGNSAFVLLVSTIMPIYFNHFSENAGISAADYLAFWGYAASAVTIIVALIGPVFGTLADTQGLKKPIFTITMLVGALGCLALGLDSTGLLLALLVTQLVAFPFAILFGRLSNRYDTEKMILICIAEYFGLMDICGKGASFLGTIVISLVSQLTGQVNIGVGAISLFFILGMIVFKMSTAETTSM